MPHYEAGDVYWSGGVHVRTLKSGGQAGALANVCFRRAPLAFSTVGDELRENITQSYEPLSIRTYLVFEAGYK